MRTSLLDTLPGRAAVFVLAAMQVVASAATGGGPRPGKDNFWAALLQPTPIQPAPYAFAIWGVIFLGALAFAVRQLGMSERDEPWLARARLWAACGFAASTGWMLAAEFAPVWSTMPLILVMLASFTAAFQAASEAVGQGRAAFWTAALPFGLYVGWLTVAAFANLLVLLARLEPGDVALAAATFASLALALAAAVRLAVRRIAAVGAVVAVAWGLVGIAVANRGERPLVAAAAATGALVIVLVYLSRRGRTASRMPFGHRGGIGAA